MPLMVSVSASSTCAIRSPQPRRVAVPAQRWDADSFAEFIERKPDLLNRKLVEHFYSRELIFSDSARALWTASDIRPLPALV
jgi:hypothetical protein